MAEGNRPTLHGMWASPCSKMVEFALRVKQIEYEYVEEDLQNKSQLLLKYNPVHKKVPVLVHNGKPVVESLMILEYIDETWKDGSGILLDDPYRRAIVRFWANFVHQQVFETILVVIKSEGKAKEKAIEQVHEKLKLLEEGMNGCFPTITGDSEDMGLLDMVMCSLISPHKVYEEVLGLKFIGSDKYPLIYSWLKSLAELPLVKELAVPHQKSVGFVRFLRERALNSSPSDFSGRELSIPQQYRKMLTAS